MNTHDKIELPPLPEWVGWPVTVSEMSASDVKEAMQDYARAAIEADRQRSGEPVGYFYPWELERSLKAYPNGFPGAVAVFAAPQSAEPVKGESVAWQPIDTAPTDNKRPLYLARFHEGELVELDFNGRWEYWQESYEMPHINGYAWESNNGIEEPTHWAYQDDPLPTTAPQPAEPSDSLPRHVAQTLADAIYKAAQKMGIANGDHSTLSVPQCLHLLDCMSQPAEQSPAQKRRERLRSDPVKAAVLDGARERIAAELANRAEPVKRKRRYAQGTALGEFGIIPICDQVDDEPVKVPSDLPVTEQEEEAWQQMEKTND